jgi:hypothetical protein
LLQHFSDIEVALLFELFFSPLKKFAWEPNYVTMTLWHTLDARSLVSTISLDQFIEKFSTNNAWALITVLLSGSEGNYRCVVLLLKMIYSNRQIYDNAV